MDSAFRKSKLARFPWTMARCVELTWRRELGNVQGHRLGSSVAQIYLQAKFAIGALGIGGTLPPTWSELNYEKGLQVNKRQSQQHHSLLSE